MNLYGYSENDPVNSADQSGLSADPGKCVRDLLALGVDRDWAQLACASAAGSRPAILIATVIATAQALHFSVAARFVSLTGSHVVEAALARRAAQRTLFFKAYS
jgi:hypothetical protein